jgi:hypothetical protein
MVCSPDRYKESDAANTLRQISLAGVEKEQLLASSF